MLIKKVFADFLKDQKSRVSIKTYREYETIIGLFEDCLDGYAWDGLDDENAYKKSREKNLTFMDLYDHTFIWDNVDEFLGYFIPRKVNWGDGFVLTTCPRVIRKLLKWMRDKDLLDKTDEEINDQCENQTWEDSLKEMGMS